MSIQIKTTTLEPVRKNFSNLERRFGDKPATRYQEATYDLQAEVNFHYKPLWQPEHSLNDKARTKIEMSDWYALKDPRQFYYGTYVQNRAKMQEAAENSFAFFEKRNLVANLSSESKELIINYLIPLRHVEHTANLNNMYGCAFGYGTAITQALIYNATDRLGLAQYLSRIGLSLDNNTGDSLTQAKESWMSNSDWQPVRALCEKTTLVEDWVEVFIAQNLVIDTFTYNIFFQQLDEHFNTTDARDIALLTEIFHSWNKDMTRWLEATIKTMAAESDANKQHLKDWASKWQVKAREALAPIATKLLGSEAIKTAEEELNKKLTKLGLN